MPKKVKEIDVKTATPEGAVKKQPMSKRKKIIIICVSLCVVAVIAVTAVILISLDRHKQTGVSYKPSVEYKRYYSYVIDVNEGDFYLNPTFVGNVPYSEFTITAKEPSESISVGEDFVVKHDGAMAGERATFEVCYKNTVIADIAVAIKEVDGYISTEDGLFSMRATGVYALARDLDITGDTRRIGTFSGEFYGNGHKIRGLDMGKGCLFAELRGATVEGLELIGVCGEAVANKACGIGPISGIVGTSTVSRCLVEGRFSVKSTLTPIDMLYVGGVIGYASSSDKATSLEDCKGNVSDVEIAVFGSGDVKVGGIVGGANNYMVKECRSYARIDVSVGATEVGNLGTLCVGGAVGVSQMTNKVAVGVYDLDEAVRLFSYAKIKVSVVGGNDYNTCFVGGVFGKIVDQSVANASFDGEIDVNVTRARVVVGGILGSAKNDSGYRMALRGASNGGTVKVYSYGTVEAGGLIGNAVRTEYEKCEVVNEPIIETDASKVQGKQTKSNAIGVSQ